MMAIVTLAGRTVAGVSFRFVRHNVGNETSSRLAMNVRV
jgi:hypothetical protein